MKVRSVIGAIVMTAFPAAWGAAAADDHAVGEFTTDPCPIVGTLGEGADAPSEGTPPCELGPTDFTNPETQISTKPEKQSSATASSGRQNPERKSASSTRKKSSRQTAKRSRHDTIEIAPERVVRKATYPARRVIRRVLSGF